jgi:hypothetical protein
MKSEAEQLPRVFQANLARLYERVILPGLEALPLHPHLEHGVAATLKEFLDNAAAQVDNYTANEAAKAYTLTLAAIFERQLSVWARALQAAGRGNYSKLRGFDAFLAACAQEAEINLSIDSLGDDLGQMFIVANVVRHGDGQSCNKLRSSAPELWDTQHDYYDLLPGDRVESEQLRIRRADLVRYVRATTRFWGLADPLPMAVTDVPYR